MLTICSKLVSKSSMRRTAHFTTLGELDPMPIVSGMTWPKRNWRHDGDGSHSTSDYHLTPKLELLSLRKTLKKESSRIMQCGQCLVRTMLLGCLFHRDVKQICPAEHGKVWLKCIDCADWICYQQQQVTRTVYSWIKRCTIGDVRAFDGAILSYK